MFFAYKPNNSKLAERLRDWRTKAFAKFVLAVFWAMVTPVMAGMAQHQVVEEAVSHWLISATIGIWPYLYLTAILFMFIMIEILNAVIVKESSFAYDERVDKIVAKLAKRAGLRSIPIVVYIPSKYLINAGAGTSYLFGNKIVLFGDIVKLSDEQLESVIAHEIAHLRMGDVRAGHFLGSLMFSLRLVNVLILLACISAIFVDEHDVLWYLAVTYIITLVGSRVARSFQLQFSRVCEYRADALAVDFTTPGHREHLINALKSVRELSLVVALRKSELNEIDSGTHPTARNRAKSLGLFRTMNNVMSIGS